MCNVNVYANKNCLRLRKAGGFLSRPPEIQTDSIHLEYSVMLYSFSLRYFASAARYRLDMSSI